MFKGDLPTVMTKVELLSLVFGLLMVAFVWYFRKRDNDKNKPSSDDSVASEQSTSQSDQKQDNRQ